MSPIPIREYYATPFIFQGRCSSNNLIHQYQYYFLWNSRILKKIGLHTVTNKYMTLKELSGINISMIFHIINFRVYTQEES